MLYTASDRRIGKAQGLCAPGNRAWHAGSVRAFAVSFLGVANIAIKPAPRFPVAVLARFLAVTRMPVRVRTYSTY